MKTQVGLRVIDYINAHCNFQDSHRALVGNKIKKRFEDFISAPESEKEQYWKLFLRIFYLDFAFINNDFQAQCIFRNQLEEEYHLDLEKNYDSL